MLSEQMRIVLGNWLTQAAKKQNEPLFTGRNHTGKPLSPRQLCRLAKGWAVMIGLDPTNYGTETLRRTRAMHIA